MIHRTMVLPTIATRRIREKQNVQMTWSTVQFGLENSLENKKSLVSLLYCQYCIFSNYNCIMYVGFVFLPIHSLSLNYWIIEFLKLVSILGILYWVPKIFPSCSLQLSLSLNCFSPRGAEELKGVWSQVSGWNKKIVKSFII